MIFFVTCAPPAIIRERNLNNNKKVLYFYRPTWKVKGITKVIAEIPFHHFLWKIVSTVEQLIHTAGLL